MKWIAKVVLLALPGMLMMSGCASDRQPFEGVVTLPIASSVFPVLAQGVQEFEKQYPKARVNISRQNCRSAIDSLLKGKTRQIVLDRPLTHPESLAFQRENQPLVIHRLARTPMSFIVNQANSIDDLDSLQLAAILTGTIRDWSQINSREDGPILLYLPLPGEGVWELIQVLFKTPKEIVAVVAPSDSIEMLVASHRNSLGAKCGVVSDWVKPVGIRFGGKIQRPTLRAIHEGRYPWVIPIVFIMAEKSDIDVGTSFLTFMGANAGQRILANAGVLPAMVPLKIVDTKPAGTSSR